MFSASLGKSSRGWLRHVRRCETRLHRRLLGGVGLLQQERTPPPGGRLCRVSEGIRRAGGLAIAALAILTRNGIPQVPRTRAKRGSVTSLPARWFSVRAAAKEHDENQLRRLRVPARDLSAGDLALSPVHAELSRRRGLARGAPARLGNFSRATPPSPTPSTSDAVRPRLEGAARFAPWRRARGARRTRQLETFAGGARRRSRFDNATWPAEYRRLAPFAAESRRP